LVVVTVVVAAGLSFFDRVFAGKVAVRHVFRDI
jgi:hypothetical protein